MFKNFVLFSLLAASVACKRSSTPPAPAATTAPAAASTGTTPSGAPAVKPVPAQLPDVVAKVNGEAITRAEFENAVRNLEGRAGASVPAERRDEVFRQVLDQLVSFHLLTQETRARALTVPDAQVEAQVGELKKQFPTDTEFINALKARGVPGPRSPNVAS